MSTSKSAGSARPSTVSDFEKQAEPPSSEMVANAMRPYVEASKMRKPPRLVPPLEGETINYATK